MALERGWTDGLVVAPPTRERVDKVIAYLGRRPDEVVGVLGPKDGIATIEQIAINCVMHPDFDVLPAFPNLKAMSRWTYMPTLRSLTSIRSVGGLAVFMAGQGIAELSAAPGRA